MTPEQTKEELADHERLGELRQALRSYRGAFGAKAMLGMIRRHSPKGPAQADIHVHNIPRDKWGEVIYQCTRRDI